MFARQAVGVLLVASVLMGAGCSPSKSKDPQTKAPVPSTSPSLGPRGIAERDALAAYRGMWNAFVEAGKTSDPDAPDVRKYSSDQALRLIVSSLYADREQSKVTKGELVLNPSVTEVKPVEAPTEVTV